ncbi:MAG: type III polyketide synthase [bacterium]|nr:type III polyketide synthase [bacterium]
MAFVMSAARALAEYSYEQDEVEPWLASWLSEKGHDPERVVKMCRNSEVASRSSVLPIEDIFRPRSLTESNRIYQENVKRLGERVAMEAIKRANLTPQDIDMIISVSCTGFMIPSVDAYLINGLGMRPDTKRLPITEMGCAAGAVGLSRAREYLKGFPEHRVLLLSVELPTLTFQHDDMSMDNIVSSIIFGDGAAATVLGGSPSNGSPELYDSQTTTLPDSTHLMGFDLEDKGFRIRLSRDIPAAVRSRVRPMLEAFLRKNGLLLENIAHLVFHPGGKRILEVYRDELGVSEDSLRFSRKVLRECGNISSCTVLMVLDEIMRYGEVQSGDIGLILAMGPGFSIEQLLVRWGNGRHG